LFCAGDVSGDIHCAHLVREVLSRHPDWKIYALGGQHLREAGAEIVGDTSGFGVIGFASALAVIPQVVRMRSHILQWLRQNKVDAVVLCDWGAFNVRLLRVLKELSVPVFYYFPPRSWQKHGNGGLGIVPYVTQVATPFEWSAQRLRAAGCKAEWVGHPLLEMVRAAQPGNQLRARYGVERADQKLIALLPGSRDMELKYIAPHLNATARQLRRENANWKFVVAVPAGAKQRAQKYFDAGVEITEGRAAEILLACDAAIVKSGTATLEAAVANAPQIVVYNVPTLLRIQWVATGSRKKIPFVAMPNIILERQCVPEFLANECRAEVLVPQLRKLLTEPLLRDTMRQGYTEVRRALGSELPVGATVRTATMIEEMLKSRD
jgi:lipid-A-disaccharide synthase